VYLSEPERQLLYTFIRGLNDPELTAKGLDILERNPPGAPPIKLTDMMNRLTLIEQSQAQSSCSQSSRQQQQGQMDMADVQRLLLKHTQMYRVSSAGGSSNAAASKGRFGQEVDAMIEGHYPNDPSKQGAALCQLLSHLTDPDNPDALCYQHGHGLHHKRAKPHSNRNCSVTKHVSKQQLQGFAARTESPSATEVALMQRIDSLGEQLQAMALLQQQRAPGLPQQTPKAALELGGKGKGNNNRGGQQQKQQPRGSSGALRHMWL